MQLKLLGLFVLLIGIFGCADDPDITTSSPTIDPDLTIFFVNDQHGQINNFAKVKFIVDAAKANGNVLLVSAGDIFAGNPIVDQFSEPGFPMVDIMNQTGFDLGVLGNHEFDFGTEVLSERIEESNFPWILANIDASNSPLEQPDPFVTLSVGEFRVTFLGLIETNGRGNDTIPATHPLRVADLSFQPHQDVVQNYANLKAQENADVLVALTHLGAEADRNLALNYPFFDLIIGGHSHDVVNETVNNVPIAQAGANLQLLGKIDLYLEGQTVTEVSISTIDLNNISTTDPDLVASIANYNATPEFGTVVGQSDFDHFSFGLGCFFTNSLKEFMDVDFAIQNFGGIRAGINQGPITAFEIYSMDPFNNQSVVFTKTVGEYERFFCETGDLFFYSGINIDTTNNDFQIVDENGVPLPDGLELTMGVNDFIPAVYDEYFDFSEAEIKSYTTAEAIIGYLENSNTAIDFEGCLRVIDCN